MPDLEPKGDAGAAFEAAVRRPLVDELRALVAQMDEWEHRESFHDGLFDKWCEVGFRLEGMLKRYGAPKPEEDLNDA
jgi:hypothetical protein